MHLHLDPIGGVAGDMFAAALLDAFPDATRELVPALHAGGLADDVIVRVERVTDDVLAGTRFVVEDPREAGAPRPPHHAVLGAGHAHVPFVAIRDRIARAALPRAVIDRAVDILSHLADAEARVHGSHSVEEVSFHEVGAQDSIADIVAAAWLLEHIGARTFSIGSIPIGAGQVKTAHGMLPVPSPATTLLLAGLRTHDDGLLGERTTPTGAAIVKHLSPLPRKLPGLLGRSGTGWGTKRFPGTPNVLRVLTVLPAETAASGASLVTSRVARIAFEIDDQTAEDLAIGLDHVRALPGVLDVLQAPAFGKKGRMITSVQVLCALDARDAAVRACLMETTTLGARVDEIERMELPRELALADGVRVKHATRPDGMRTTKVESDELRTVHGAAARAAARDISRGRT